MWQNRMKEEWETIKANLSTERRYYIDMVEGIKPDLVITFNTNRMLHRTVAINLVLEFERRINSRLFGKSARNHPCKLLLLHFYEYKSGNSHIHSALLISPGMQQRFNNHAPRIWAKLSNRYGKKGHLYIDSYNERVSTYITKKMDMVETTAY